MRNLSKAITSEIVSWGMIALFIGGIVWMIDTADIAVKKEYRQKAEQFRLSLTGDQTNEVARTVEQLIMTQRGSLVVFKQQEGGKEDLGERTRMVLGQNEGCVAFKALHQKRDNSVCFVDQERDVLKIEQVIVDDSDPRYARAAWAYLRKPYFDFN